MDDRHIPDPIVKDRKIIKKRGPKNFVKNFILKRLIEGRLTDKEIAEEARVLYGGSTSAKSVQWHKHHFKKEGLIEGNNRHIGKRRHLTHFTFELIYLELDPPDNVEVIDTPQLITFAQKIALMYAKKLPNKPIEEIIYDINTAKAVLKASKKFEVIDQNNYDEPSTMIGDDIEEEGEEYDTEEREEYDT